MSTAQQTQVQEIKRLGRYEIVRSVSSKDCITLVFDSNYGPEIVHSMNCFADRDYHRRLTILVDSLVDKIPINLGVYTSPNSGIVVRSETDATRLTISQRDLEKRQKDIELLEEILQ